MDEHSLAAGELADGLARARTRLLDLRAGEIDSAAELLEAALSHADSPAEHDRVRAELSDTRAVASSIAERLRTLHGRVDDLLETWLSANRYSERGLLALRGQIAAQAASDPAHAARRWAGELVTALEDGELDAARSIATFRDLFGPALAQSSERFAEIVARFDGESAAGLPSIDELRQVADADDLLDDRSHARIHRLAGALAVRKLNDVALARAHLDRALELAPRSGATHAALAALALRDGELDLARQEAEKAVDLAPEAGECYLCLGACAESSGDFTEADELYLSGLDRMAPEKRSRLRQRLSLLEPSGRLLVAAAGRSVEDGAAEEALAMVDQAVRLSVRGPELYPDAEAYSVRSAALQALPDSRSAEAAAEANRAARLHIWNGQPARAEELLRRSLELDPSIEDTGWLLADAVMGQQRALSDGATVARARRAWEDWAARVGPPHGDNAWAYRTRAWIVEAEAALPDADARTAIWDSLAYAQRALVHRPAWASSWAAISRYMRLADMDQNALETGQHAYDLLPSDPDAQSSLLAAQANLGLWAEAEATLQDYLAARPEMAWLAGIRAWVAFHLGHYGEAEQALAMALASQQDPAWELGLRALCRIADGRESEAREDFASLSGLDAPPSDGASKCQRAMAAAIIGDHERAEEWKRAADKDSSTTRGELLETAAFLALAADRITEGGQHLRDALDASPAVRDVEDVGNMLLLRLKALVGSRRAASRREREARKILDVEMPRRRAEIERDPPTPESELARAIARHAVDTADGPLVGAAVALLARRAQRSEQSEELGAAAADYERLVDSSFAPEARLARRRCLERAAEERASAQDLEGFRLFESWLVRTGDATDPETAMAVANSLVALDLAAEAADLLTAAIAATSGGSQRDRLHERLSLVHLRTGDLTRAGAELQAALEGATARGDDNLAGEIQLMQAIVAAAADDDGTTTTRLQGALDSWQSAGAYEPEWILIDTLRNVLGMESVPRGSGMDIRAAVTRLGEEIREFAGNRQPGDAELVWPWERPSATAERLADDRPLGGDARPSGGPRHRDPATRQWRALKFLRTESLQSYLRVALLVAVSAYAIAAFADFDGTWWNVLRVVASGVFVVCAVALGASWLVDRRRPSGKPR